MKGGLDGTLKICNQQGHGNAESTRKFKIGASRNSRAKVVFTHILICWVHVQTHNMKKNECLHSIFLCFLSVKKIPTGELWDHGNNRRYFITLLRSELHTRRVYYCSLLAGPQGIRNHLLCIGDTRSKYRRPLKTNTSLFHPDFRSYSPNNQCMGRPKEQILVRLALKLASCIYYKAV